jgi:type IV secretion system protein VirD4
MKDILIANTEMRKSKHINMGWELENGQSRNQYMGFQQSREGESLNLIPVIHDGNSHICTIGKTGSGKNVNMVTPILLDFVGAAIVLDVKPELKTITARERRRIGKVVVLAPFSEEQGSFNPLDCLMLDPDIEITAQFLASLIVVNSFGARDPFWPLSAEAYLAGVIMIAMCDPNPENRNLRKVCEIMLSDDVVYSLAVILDTRGKDIPRAAYQAISTLLQTADVTRSGIIATAQAYLRIFNSEKVLSTLDSSSFSLNEFRLGKEPITIYIQIPAAYLESHASLIRLWVGTLMKAITSRTSAPDVPTLLVLDEAATLGTFSYLNTMICFCRGMGLITHTLWQDLSQIKSLYTNWETLLNNCTLQFFQTSSHLAAKAVSEVTGVPVRDIISMRTEDQLLVLSGGETKIVRKLNYLTDTLYAGKWDENPLINMSDKGLKRM